MPHVLSIIRACTTPVQHVSIGPARFLDYASLPGLFVVGKLALLIQFSVSVCLEGDTHTIRYAHPKLRSLSGGVLEAGADGGYLFLVNIRDQGAVAFNSYILGASIIANAKGLLASLVLIMC